MHAHAQVSHLQMRIAFLETDLRRRQAPAGITMASVFADGTIVLTEALQYQRLPLTALVGSGAAGPGHASNVRRCCCVDSLWRRFFEALMVEAEQHAANGSGGGVRSSMDPAAAACKRLRWMRSAYYCSKGKSTVHMAFHSS